MTVHRPPARPLPARPSAPQGNQCSISHFLASLGAQEDWYSRSTSNFYALIGQNLTGEFMRKIYAASWNLFTLTAEADIVLCQLVMFLTVFFHWMFTAFRCLIYPNTLRYLPHRFSANRRLKINKIRRHKDLSASAISKQFSSSTHLSNFDQSEIRMRRRA